MEKVLTICIPSYNMEKYLSRCLDSLIVPSLDKLEIIIVNDGSKDGTLQIAEKYKSKYPQSIVIINKANGHYGSTINASLKIATGKYFRILDADDWFDSTVLETFIKKLENIDVDCVFTRFTTVNADNIKINQQDYSLVSYDKILNLEKYEIPSECLAMHSLTFSLNLLKDIKHYQTEGICYTDIEYVFYPLKSAKTMYCIDESLYQYFLGRDDQSMAFKNIFKNLSHFKMIYDRLLGCCDFSKSNINVINIQKYYILSLMDKICLISILGPKRDYTLGLREKIHYFKSESKDIYEAILNLQYGFIPYVKIWYYFGKMGSIFLLPLKYRLMRKCK